MQSTGNLSMPFYLARAFCLARVLQRLVLNLLRTTPRRLYCIRQPHALPLMHFPLLYDCDRVSSCALAYEGSGVGAGAIRLRGGAGAPRGPGEAA